ncbi:MAG TPA: hypothetical protein VHB21_03195 [Minicystis sp.]|nr:hypothetical protein [Minicystis sp.]
MRLAIVTLAVGSALLVAASYGCGSDSGSGGSGGSATGGNGTGGTNTGGTSTGGSSTGGTTSTGGSTGTGTSTQGSGGAASKVDPICTGITFPPDMPPSGGSCVTISGKIKCNPVTNEGCDAASGESCDEGQSDGTFSCYPGNTQDLCQQCDGNSLFCKTGMSCPLFFPELDKKVKHECARYCCSDDDCAGGTCSPLYKTLLPGLGLCTEPIP